MAVEAKRLPIEVLAEAAERVAAAGDLRSALAAVADGTAVALAADLVVVRVVGDEGALVARAAAPERSALAAAEVAATRADPERLADGHPSDAVLRAADRAAAAPPLAVVARADGRVVGAIEAVRQEPFSRDEEALAALAAAQVALAVRGLAGGPGTAAGLRRLARLELAGEALVAGGEPSRTALQALRLAVEATGARGGIVWRLDAEGAATRVATVGDADAVLPWAAALATETLESGWRPPSVADGPAGPSVLGSLAEFSLGRPAFGTLQLLYPPDAAPDEHELAVLATFAARTAHALHSGEHARAVAEQLERTRALLEVVTEASARLSLAHTLETAVERVSELLQVERIGIYLRDEERLLPAAGRGVGGGHDEVVQRVSEAFRGPLRARTSLLARVSGREPALGGVRAALHGIRQQSVAAVPLRVREEPVGLLVAYPGRRELSESDLTLLAALAAQLAVAVQNARLHERATELGSRLYEVLDAERQASRRVNALYEISRSFAQTLSLDSTLTAVTQTLVEQLGVDAAVIRVPDARGDQLRPHAVRVAESRLSDAVRTILERPQPHPARRREPVLLDAALAARLGGAHALLRPFLEAGSTAALVPIASPAELLAELTIVSLDPAAPITGETLATARSIAQQAALAIDNARLYQQQKQFAETMQQSLLPGERPDVPGLEVGRVYESAAQVDVGGDVYDFLELGDGRLAVVLGDVTGHGIDATADMAMAKFVFRSLAREHSEPSAFLARANDVVVDEIATGKFITMAYLTVDRSGHVLCAAAGHPEPRLVHADGRVEALRCGGLALGIVAGEQYDQVAARLPPGGAVVLFTDGVIEARRGRELFGGERLDEVLAAGAGCTAQEAADAVLAACRGFAGGDLADDCAVVVIRRAA